MVFITKFFVLDFMNRSFYLKNLDIYEAIHLHSYFSNILDLLERYDYNNSSCRLTLETFRNWLPSRSNIVDINLYKELLDCFLNGKLSLYYLKTFFYSVQDFLSTIFTQSEAIA